MFATAPSLLQVPDMNVRFEEKNAARRSLNWHPEAKQINLFAKAIQVLSKSKIRNMKSGVVILPRLLRNTSHVSG